MAKEKKASKTPKTTSLKTTARTAKPPKREKAVKKDPEITSSGFSLPGMAR